MTARTVAPSAAPGGPRVDVRIDSTVKHQVIEGFGAGHISLVYKGLGDILGPDLRARAIEAAYNQVKLTTGYIDHVVLESPGGYDQRRNDDDDPFHINGNGFNHNAVDDFKQKVLDLARPKGFDNFFLAQRVNVRWASPWLDDIRSRDYNRYLDECAEQVLAGLLYWRNTYGITPRYNLLFNEPTSGNGELLNGNVKDVIDIIKRAGARLRKEGFPDVKFVIPNEETEEHSLAVAAAVLADPEARQYVGAIGYHPYPYGSPYVSVPRILSSAGAGRPDVGRVELRQKLRDLGRQYGIPLWMTEVSHGEVPAQSFDALLGRAIHIHDELVYTDAAMYLTIQNMWSAKAQELHFSSYSGSIEDGPVVFVDNSKNSVSITGMGYAIGHYARWVKRGATRVEASSSDPLVQVIVFRDDAQKQLVLVAINNRAAATTVNIAVNGATLGGNLRGEQSTAAAAWQPLAPAAPNTPTSFALLVPPKSITTIMGQVTAFADK